MSDRATDPPTAADLATPERWAADAVAELVAAAIGDSEDNGGNGLLDADDAAMLASYAYDIGHYHGETQRICRLMWELELTDPTEAQRRIAELVRQAVTEAVEAAALAADAYMIEAAGHTYGVALAVRSVLK